MPRQRPISPGVSTSLDSVHITPRTPRAVRPTHADDSAEAGDFVSGGVDAEEVEMSLLGQDERRRARPGFADGDRHLHVTHKAPLSPEDKRAMVLLCVLCTSPFFISSGRSTIYITALARRLDPGRSRAYCRFFPFGKMGPTFLSDRANQIGLALGTCVNSCVVNILRLMRIARFYRLYPLHTARASFVLPARDIRVVQLPLLSQAALVTHRRCRLLPLCGSQEVMDNPDANHHRFHDALDVGYRPGVHGQRLCFPVPLQPELT